MFFVANRLINLNEEEKRTITATRNDFAMYEWSCDLQKYEDVKLSLTICCIKHYVRFTVTNSYMKNTLARRISFVKIIFIIPAIIAYLIN